MVRSFAGTFGVLSIGENQLKKLNITDLRFMLSMSSEKFRQTPIDQIDNSTNVFAFTFKNRLRLAFQFSYPSLSLSWGEVYARNIYNILHCFSETGNSDLSLKSLVSTLNRFN